MSGTRRVLQGSSFDSDQSDTRSADHNSLDPHDYGDDLGFRVAMNGAKREATQHILRGSSFGYNQRYTHSAYRSKDYPHYRNFYDGFRVVKK